MNWNVQRVGHFKNVQELALSLKRGGVKTLKAVVVFRVHLIDRFWKRNNQRPWDRVVSFNKWLIYCCETNLRDRVRSSWHLYTLCGWRGIVYPVIGLFYILRPPLISSTQCFAFFFCSRSVETVLFVGVIVHVSVVFGTFGIGSFQAPTSSRILIIWAF